MWPYQGLEFTEEGEPDNSQHHQQVQVIQHQFEQEESTAQFSNSAVTTSSSADEGQNTTTTTATTTATDVEDEAEEGSNGVLVSTETNEDAVTQELEDMDTTEGHEGEAEAQGIEEGSSVFISADFTQEEAEQLVAATAVSTEDSDTTTMTMVKCKIEPGLAPIDNSSMTITPDLAEHKSEELASQEIGTGGPPAPSEPTALWEENGCIICNARMQVDNPDNLNLANVELKTFYAKMLGLGDGLQLDQESTYPFCSSCTEDVTQLKSIAHKIEFMHRQFDKMRDNLARKTVQTFLERKEPELLLKEEAEMQQANVSVDPQSRLTLRETIYNRWRSRYELNFPGPKCPVIIKTMDAKGRTTVVRMNQQNTKEVLKNIPGARTMGKDIHRIPVLKLDNDEGEIGDGEHKCKDCDKCFRTSGQLTYHSRIHSGELPFECEVCGKVFAVAHYLMIHMRSHTGEKPYKCEVCGKGFAQRGGLVTHSLVHSGEKPFQCNECSKSFRQKYHLTQHLLIHSGAKPFGCELCGKFFNVKMNLREHMRRHTGDRPYKCPYCLIVGFFRKKMLRDHIVKAHPSKQLPGELENLSESIRPPSSRRASTDDANSETPASKRRRMTKIKVEESSDEGDVGSFTSRSPSPIHEEEEEAEVTNVLSA